MNIFDETCYKTIVTRSVEMQKSGGRGYWRKIAGHLGISSTLISQIFKDNKELTAEQALGVAEFWGWSEVETDYFIHLVLLARASTPNYRKRIEEKIQDIRRRAQVLKERVQQNVDIDEPTKAIYYSDWKYAATWILSSIESFQSLQEIGGKLGVPVNRLREIVDFLQQHRLITREGDRISLGQAYMHLEAGSPMIGSHHRNWRLKAVEKASNIDPSELMYTCPLSISEEDFKELRAQIVHLIDEATKRIVASPAEVPACLSIDLIRW